MRIDGGEVKRFHVRCARGVSGAAVRALDDTDDPDDRTDLQRGHVAPLDNEVTVGCRILQTAPAVQILAEAAQRILWRTGYHPNNSGGTVDRDPDPKFTRRFWSVFRRAFALHKGTVSNSRSKYRAGGTGASGGVFGVNEQVETLSNQAGARADSLTFLRGVTTTYLASTRDFLSITLQN
ncbi:hypothetical protein [Cryptosporangium sp. NPDC048952]|uniref:hypothetical protein n=1 Tax=Cryptosporangium sp. NPDC048952 TaxID=3363961 RepID=UPI00371214D6